MAEQETTTQKKACNNIIVRAVAKSNTQHI